jgi:hypothetical protein
MPKTTKLLRDRTRRFRNWGLAVHSVCEATGRAGRLRLATTVRRLEVCRLGERPAEEGVCVGGVRSRNLSLLCCGIGFHVGRADNRSQERLLCLLGEAKRTW